MLSMRRKFCAFHGIRSLYIGDYIGKGEYYKQAADYKTVYREAFHRLLFYEINEFFDDHKRNDKSDHKPGHKRADFSAGQPHFRRDEIPPLAPIIAGMARKKENSAAVGVASPMTQPPIIVEAEREKPGQTTAMH